MSAAFQRGSVLLEQGRYDLAEREFRQALSQAPDDALSHALLALCLNQLDRNDEALREADEAVRGGPGLAFCHYVRGCVLLGFHRLPEAETSVNEAIRLNPASADYHALVAAIELERRNWKTSLEAADRGLALDPEHPGCMNYRAMALVHLGRKQEAAATLGSALADDPQNALTHANQGWALLHQGSHQQALEHFREALRLDPNLEWARIGVVEALKARFLIYRLMLGFFLWMGRQSHYAQMAVVVGIVFGQNLLRWLGQSFPFLSPFITPILIFSFGFLLMTWISSPLFNLTLRFNKFGRMALSGEQKVESNWIGACFLLAAVSTVMYFVGYERAFPAMLYFGLLLFPLAVTFGLARGRNRWIGAALTLGLAVAGALSISLIEFREPRSLVGTVNAKDLFQTFVLGTMISTWLPTVLGRVLRNR